MATRVSTTPLASDSIDHRVDRGSPADESPREEGEVDENHVQDGGGVDSDSDDDDDAGSLVDFILDDTDALEVADTPGAQALPCGGEMDGIDPGNIVTGKRKRRQTQFYEREVFSSENYRKMILVDVPDEEMHAVFEDSENEDEGDEDSGEEGEDSGEDNEGSEDSGEGSEDSGEDSGEDSEGSEGSGEDNEGSGEDSGEDVEMCMGGGNENKGRGGDGENARGE
tara:strand:- start:76 stop:750 length:675 start_codon:yes stop_codon:yes gene_type:complete